MDVEISFHYQKGSLAIRATLPEVLFLFRQPDVVNQQRCAARGIDIKPDIQLTAGHMDIIHL